MNSLDTDWRIRLAAFAELKRLRDAKNGLDIATRDELARGFVFEGERIRLIPPRQGIWKPRQMGSHGAALSIVTVAPKPGRPAPYDDQLDEETVLVGACGVEREIALADRPYIKYRIDKLRKLVGGLSFGSRLCHNLRLQVGNIVQSNVGEEFR